MSGIPSGTIGIFCIGFIGGYYFARFFDRTTSITPMQFGTLLTLLGIGPTALVLVQGYFRLSLLDPYGIGLVLGVLVNFRLRNTQENIALKTLIPPLDAPSGAIGTSETPKIGFLQTVSATSSAGSLPDTTIKAIERRYLLQVARQAVERWLQLQFPDVEARSREVFPDFLVKTHDRRVGIEVLTAGQSRAILNLLLRQFLLRVRKSIDAKEFEESWLVLVADDIDRARELSELLSEWRPGPPVRIVVGTVDGEGIFRPLDTVEEA